jgi:ATP-dependent helicase HrpA
VSDFQQALDQISSQIRDCLARDQPGLRRRARSLAKRLEQKKPIDRALPGLKEQVERSVARRQQRLDNRPGVSYPEQLPVSQKREDIAEQLAQHQVIIVCGETGSGKTTQLPKICLELGRGSAGMIGHTQPRRIAARSVATRVAEELKVPLGQGVGFKVRFSDHSHQEGYIKLMTDGILLAEIQSDPDLRQYDTLIIDEAHERSLNIDFLLGYLRQLLPRRPNLKIIITSATIDPERFSKHFNDAPIIMVSGRSFPVEVRYRPLVSEDEDGKDRDRQQALLEAVDELAMEGPGDILVFLPGEREIRETAEALRKHHPPHTEILPLYARLSASEQQQVFKDHPGRRIVLSTNVAETSLTVPGIRYVVDTGVARISRYSWRAKVQRLHIEAISQASANQRSGRCGRVAEGICIRLYSEEDFEGRPLFTDAEILRTNLASVILQMASMGLGNVEAFPFIDPPDTRLIKDGYKLLFELGAVDDRHRITRLGKQLARLPIDPRLGRMLLEGERLGVLSELLVITSSLAVQDPRERPHDKRQAADEAHEPYQDSSSDFIARLNLWRDFQEQSKHLSNNKLRKYCQQRFISYLRMREWLSLYKQLRGQMLEMGFHERAPSDNFDSVHQAILTGLLDQVGFREEDGGYLGARNRHFRIFPASGLAKKGPKWIMAAQLLDTARLYALEVAAIRPEWVERYAAHLIKRQYFEPHWQKRHAQVGAYERVTLYGLVLQAKRRINFGPIDPVQSREIFIRHALVQGEYHSQAACIEQNRQLIEDIEDLEARSRRRDILIDEDTLFDFYDQRLPDRIHNGPAFERWYREQQKKGREPLALNREDLVQRETSEISSARFPDHLQIGQVRLPLSYHFEPGHEADGVTLHVPIGLLRQIETQRCDWLVPGLLEEKLTALIRGLPKALRKNYVPAPDFARACASSLPFGEGILLEQFADCLKRMTGVPIEATEWDAVDIPEHLMMRFSLEDEEREIVDSARDLGTLRERWSEASEAHFEEQIDDNLEREGITEWDFEPLPEQVEIDQGGYSITAWPALVDNRDSVAIKLFDSQEQAATQHRDGLLRLFMLQLHKQSRALEKTVPNEQKLCLLFASIGRCLAFKQDFTRAVFIHVFMTYKQTPDNREAFLELCTTHQEKINETAEELSRRLLDILERHHQILQSIKGNLPLSWIEAVGDIREQLSQLIYPGFIARTPWPVLQQMPRYLKAIERRLERLDHHPDADRLQRIEIQPLSENFNQLLEKHPEASEHPDVQAFRWQLEELRVSLFAQQLGTPEPVSVKRMDKQLRLITSLFS